MLQAGDSVGRPHVFVAAHAEGIFTAHVERILQDLVLPEGEFVQANRLFHDFEHTDTFDLRGGAGEILVDHLFL